MSCCFNCPTWVSWLLYSQDYSQIDCKMNKVKLIDKHSAEHEFPVIDGNFINASDLKKTAGLTYQV